MNSSLDRDLISVYYKNCTECIFIYSDSLEYAQENLEKETIFSPENVYFIDYHDGMGDSTTTSMEEALENRTKSDLLAFENYFSHLEEAKEFRDNELH